MPPHIRTSCALTLAVSCLATLGACRNEPVVSSNNALPASNVASPPPQIVVQPPPALDRAELLIAAARARSAAASGVDDLEAQRALDNRRFELRMRIGCTIAGLDGGQGAQARFDPERRRVALSVAQDISLDDPLVAAVGGEEVEAAEGFWIARPALLTPSCADAQADPAAVGLVRYYSGQEARTERRDGRPYATTAALPAEAASPTPGNWELVLRGRLRKRGDGRAIQCSAREPGGMPACLISVEFEEVMIEQIDPREQVARWGRG